MTAWTDNARARVRVLWAQGVTTARIAERLDQEGLGCHTRSAVIGQAHRMMLPPRASPIRRLGPGQIPKRLQRKPRVVKPKRKFVMPGAGTPMPPLPLPDMEASMPEPPVHAWLPPPVPGFSTCQWIAGEPSGDDSCKCGKPTEANVYCREHYERTIDWKNTMRIRARAA